MKLREYANNVFIPKGVYRISPRVSHVCIEIPEDITCVRVGDYWQLPPTNPQAKQWINKSHYVCICILYEEDLDYIPWKIA